MPVTSITTPESAVDFTDEAIAELVLLQTQSTSVVRDEENAIDRRAGLLFDQYKFVSTYGAVSINAYAKKLGFKYEAASLVYHVSAQVLLNVNVGASTTDAQREARQNAVRPTAYALAALDKWHDEHAHMSRQEFAAYYRKWRCMTGLRDRFLDDSRSNTRSGRNGRKVEVSSQVAQSPEEIVESILDNPAAKEVKAHLDIATGKSGLMIYRNEGDKLRLVLLNASPDQMADLSGLAPSVLENAAVDLRFHRELLLAGAAFVPDMLSTLTREEVPEGDEPNESYTLLPANAVYLVECDHLSIAHGRREDGLIVQVEPRIYRPDYMGKSDLFIDNLTRRRLSKALTGEKDAEVFARSAQDGEAASVQRNGHTTTLTFTNKDTGGTVNLIVKPRNMGDVWTYRVSLNFAPVAQAVLDPKQTMEVERSFLRELVKKAPKDRVACVEVTDAGIRLTNGKAAAMPFKADTRGSTKLSVMAEDLRRALVGLYDLSRDDSMTFELDPKGLLCIQAMTPLATYRVFVQAIEQERDEPTRSRALRDKVESLLNSNAAVVPAAA